MLPSVVDVKKLYDDLGQPATTLVSAASVGPFEHLQPFFYWACVPSDPSGNKNGTARSACDFSAHAGKSSGGADMEWSYHFDTGFEDAQISLNRRRGTNTFVGWGHCGPVVPSVRLLMTWSALG